MIKQRASERSARGRPAFAPDLLALVICFGAAAEASDALATPDGLLRPAGFELDGPTQTYGTDERTLQDGSIFDYMDGAGVAYLEHGFQRLSHTSLKNAAGHRIVVDSFEFSSPEQAQAAFADEAICPAGYVALEVRGSQCKVYNFSPDYVLCFAAGNRMVSIRTNNDEHARAVRELASGLLMER
ncbi:MAG: DUF6599 family protein [Acidobacteriota bacterium]